MDATGTATVQEVPSRNYVELKCCARCRHDLLIASFGRDGENANCKGCISTVNGLRDERRRMERFKPTDFPVEHDERSNGNDRDRVFDDKDLTLAEIASMIQQGKSTLRRVPKAWRIG